MTNYLLPETDASAEFFNGYLTEVAESEATIAEAIGSGAVAVIQMLRQGANDMIAELRSAAERVGEDPDAAEASFTLIYQTLIDRHVHPRTNALRAASEKGQGIDREADKRKALNDMAEGLFAAIFGAEAAAETRAIVEARDAAARESVSV